MAHEMNDKEPYALVVRFKAKDTGDIQKFDAATKVMLGLMEKDPKENGTLIYKTHKVPDEPTVRIFYELYENKAAHTAHTNTKHFKAFEAEVKPYLSFWGIVSDLTAYEELARPTLYTLPEA